MRTDILYSKYRGLTREAAKRKLLWELRGGVGALISLLARMLVLAFILALLALILGHIESISAAEDRAYASASRVQHLEEVLLSCMNGNGVWVDSTLHICSFGNTHLKKGDNL